MQKWLDDSNFLTYLTHIGGKSVVPEKFIKTLNAKIYEKRQLMKVSLNFVI